MSRESALSAASDSSPQPPATVTKSTNPQKVITTRAADLIMYGCCGLSISAEGRCSTQPGGRTSFPQQCENYRSPDSQEDIADCIRNGVAQDGSSAAGLLLDLRHGRGDGLRAGASPQQQDRI